MYRYSSVGVQGEAVREVHLGGGQARLAVLDHRDGAVGAAVPTTPSGAAPHR